MADEGDGMSGMLEETPVDPEVPTEPTHAGLFVQAADTGRILLIQRSMDPEDTPDVQGTWEGPGGGIEEGESPEEAARREFSEETGLPVPNGEVTGGWRSDDGVYQGYVFTTPVEADAFPELNPDLAAAELVNPDDPERRNPDVSAWFTLPQIWNMGPALRPECHLTDWSQFAGGEMEMEQEAMVAAVVMSDGEEIDDGYIPWHGVVTVQDAPSGDRRTISKMRAIQRPLPLPVQWQRVSAPGHNNSVVVARIDSLAQVGQEVRATGVVLPVPDADDFLGLVAHFPRFGMSVDADDVLMAFDDETGSQWLEGARVCGSTFVPIPAFHQAWGALGDPPEGFMDGDSLEEEAWDNGEQALVASAATTIEMKRGPGWVTHPEETRRLHTYWTKGEGAAKIRWGVPGDFNRCRTLVGEKIAKNSPEDTRYLNQICSRWHHDAIGKWPGQEASLAPTVVNVPDELRRPFSVTSQGAMALTASAAGLTAPARWFEDPQFSTSDGRMVQDIDGTWGCPLTITPEGQVFGHVAKWGQCHTGSAPGECTTAPFSSSQYAYFLLGQVLTDEGSVSTGSLTIGGGHADVRLGMQAAIAHYDNSTNAWADVNVGEDAYGIWYAGWVRPGTTPEMIVAARASKVSGDWRPLGRSRSYEMIAALAVNSPGFPIRRIGIAAGLQTGLVAAGVVRGPEEIPEPESPAINYDLLAEKVVRAQARRESDIRETAELLARFE